MKNKSMSLILAAIATVSMNDVNAERVFGLGGRTPAQIDTDGDGAVSQEERDAARAAREEARQAIIDEFDTDGDGALNETEREAAKEARDAEREAAKTARYNEIDGDSNGAVTETELATALEDVDPERVAAVFARIDADESGAVSLEEFLNPARPEGRRGSFRGKRGMKKQGRRGGRGFGRRGGDANDGESAPPAPAPEALQ